MREYERKGIKFLNAGGSVDNSNSNKSSIVLIDIGEKISPMIYELNTKASKEKKILSVAENPPSVFC